MLREAVLALALAAVVVTPGAAAQPPLPPPLEVRLAPIPGLVDPLGPLVQSRVEVEAECLEALDPGTGASRRAYLSVSAPEWATFHLVEDSVTFPVPCTPATRVRAETFVLGRLTTLAPAREWANVTVEARMDGWSRPLSAAASTPVAADFAPGVAAHVESPARLVRPGERVALDVVVESRANGPSLVTLRVWQVFPGWSATLPEPVVLGPRGSTVALPVEVVAPADVTWAGDPGGVDLVVRAADAADPEHGAFAEVVRAVPLEALSTAGRALHGVPAPGPALALALLAAAALLARRPQRS